ncbi:MAG: endonuclease/exonuclease/phosphatase family protein [Thermoanaerobaculia bacterium]
MTRDFLCRKLTRFGLVFALLLAGAGAVAEAADAETGDTLRVLTYNVWHGLRSGESNKRFPGEDPADKEGRVAAQIREIERLAPDLIFFQEVNPNQPEARKYAQALGYDEIHKVSSCGLHIGGLYKIPRNMNEGIAILARPELGLKKIWKKRLSGNAKCTATYGFQTKESRYALFGEITVQGRSLLVATTHLSAPPFVLSAFEENLEGLVEEGTLDEAQRDEILAQLERKRQRNLAEAEGLLAQVEKRRVDRKNPGRVRPVVFGGDFNTAPGTPAIEAITAAGFTSVTKGSELPTWNPAKNEANYSIGTKRAEPLPTFDLPQIEELLAVRRTTARQIDHLFVSEGLAVESAEMELDHEVEERFLSDHFALLAVLRFEASFEQSDQSIVE